MTNPTSTSTPTIEPPEMVTGAPPGWDRIPADTDAPARSEAPAAPDAAEHVRGAWAAQDRGRPGTLKIVTTWAVLVMSVLVSANLIVADYVGLSVWSAARHVASSWGAISGDAPLPAAQAEPLPAAPGAPAPAPAPAEPVAWSMKFGETYAYENGVKMTVSAPRPYTPGQYSTSSAPHKVRMTITVENGTQAPLNVASSFMHVQSGETAADEIIDSSQDIGFGPTTGLLPGRKASWDVAYGVQNPNDIVFQGSPGLDYAGQYWTNAA